MTRKEFYEISECLSYGIYDISALDTEELIDLLGWSKRIADGLVEAIVEELANRLM